MRPAAPAARGIGASGRGLVGDVPGEAQEHVVERRAPQPEVGDGDVLGVERAHGFHQRDRALLHRHLHRAEVAVDDELAVADGEGPGEQLGGAPASAHGRAASRCTTSPPTGP